MGDKMKPLFMWAGGKNKMLKKYTNYLPEQFDSYIEPFLGGGAMFVWAYKKNPEATFFLNDANEDIMRIYQSIRNDVGNFLTTLDKYQEDFLPLSKPERKKFYYALRQEHAYNYQKWTATEEAATLYFLMKTGFNGIWQINKNTNGRFGTPSGLLNQKDKVYDLSNIEEWHRALQSCTLTSMDYTGCHKFGTPSSFAFLDPPYRGSFTQYGVDFNDQEQEKVIKLLNDLTVSGSYAIMSNRDVGDGFFESRLGDNNMVYFDVTYTAGRRKKNTDGSHSAKKAREILMIGRGQ
jgi:DNA adenine methylase